MSKLSAAAERLAKANAERTAAMQDIVEAILDADKKGYSKVEIAHQAGVSRQTVYTILDNSKKK